MLAEATSSGADSPVSVSLRDLAIGSYKLRIASSGTARYAIMPQVARGRSAAPTFGSYSTDFSVQTETFFGNDLLDPNGKFKIVRKDVIIGGEGNDVLQGGPGEDWIFGGTGNDVLSGGFDRQSGDLVWGEGGDDIYQVVTDGLPLTKAAQRRVGDAGKETFIPTYTDRFDGGIGDDQVLYLGGDLDANGRVVPDNVAVRWNTILHRYEFTARFWNFQKQTWEQERRSTG